MLKNRSALITLTLIAIIGVSLYVRSEYVLTDGKYLSGFDTYYHYRMAKSIVETGPRPAWDTLAAYPTGAPVKHPPLFHYYLAYSYKVVSLFWDVSLFEWCIYANIIPVILLIMAAFFAGRVLTNDLGGIFTALFAAVNGAVASRTVISFTDTDTFIVLFSFAATYFLFSALKSEKYALLWSSLLGLTLFLFALTWTGYWYLLLLVMAAFLGFFMMDIVKKKYDTEVIDAAALSMLFFAVPWALYKSVYVPAAILVILGVLWSIREKIHRKAGIVLSSAITGTVLVTLFTERVFSTALRAARIMGGPQPQSTLKVPDISVSVIQRYTVTFSLLGELFSLLILIAPFGIAFLLWKRDKFSLKVVVYIVFYLLGTGFMLFAGGRYTMLFAIPVILAGGAFFGVLPEILQKRVTAKGAAAAIFICSLSVVPCFVQGYKASMATPAVNDDLWEMLTWISENTPEDAVIISNWDTGYWIESIAERRTVMNGAHYDISWRVVKFGKLMETQSEEIALKEVYGFAYASEVKALRDFPENGGNFIEKEMNGFAQDNAYVLVSEWTMLTFYWTSYFGNWNYVTGEGTGRMYGPLWIQDARRIVSATEYIYGDQNSLFGVIKEDDLFHSYFIDNKEHIPTIGTIFLKDGQTYFLLKENGDVGVVYIPPEDIEFFRTERKWPGMPSEVFLIKLEDITCMLTRLYFFNGEGLHYFELVKDCGTAKLYKVHKVPQTFNQGVTTEIDTYTPA